MSIPRQVNAKSNPIGYKLSIPWLRGESHDGETRPTAFAEYSVRGMLLFLAIILVLTSSTCLRAADGGDVAGAKSRSIFDEKPPLIWLERSIAECDRSLNAYLSLSVEDEKCISQCSKRSEALPPTQGTRADDRQSMGGDKWARHKTVFESGFSEVSALSGMTAQAREGGGAGLTLAEIRKSKADFSAKLGELDAEIKDLVLRKARLDRAKLDQLKAKENKTPAERKELRAQLGFKAAADALSAKQRELDEAIAEIQKLEIKETELADRLRTLLTQRHLKEEYDLDFGKSDRRIGGSMKGYTLTELAVIMGDRQKIDELLRMETEAGIASLKRRLLEAIGDQDMRLALELIGIGADLSQFPGVYSALALSETFGQRQVSAALVSNGAWVETPWTTRRAPVSVRMRAFTHQLTRIEEFSRSIPEPHPATVKKINDLKCKLKCGGQVKPEPD